MSKQLIDRQEQGKIIAEMNGSINRISDKSYIVNSQSGNGHIGLYLNRLAVDIISIDGGVYNFSV